MALEVRFAPEAQADLLDLYSYIAAQSGGRLAQQYTDRIVTYCEGFADLSARGTRRDEIRPGLRTIGFGRRVTIAFHLTATTVVIDRLLYGGRDLMAAFDGNEN